jgi:peptide/nickel transport system substrate-binding protein
VLPTYVPSTKSVDTLTIDEWVWPIDDLNQLYFELPWPNWQTFTVYQPLVTVDETAEYHTGQIQFQPGLAANWTVSTDGKTYTFNLRQNVHFSNGDPFNAYQVWGEMYGYYMVSGNSSTWLESYPVFDMSTSNFGPATVQLMNQSGLATPSPQLMSIMSDNTWPIYVTGQYQIVFQLKAPFHWFPGTFVVYNGLMFDTDWLLKHGGFLVAGSTNPYFNQHPIPGTGPYVVTQVQENSFVKFSQDPNYWAKSMSAAEIAAQPIFDPGHAKNVVVIVKPDNIARFTDLANGVAQISAVQPSEWPVVTANPSLSFIQQPASSGEVSLLGLNSHVYPTNITAVRQAIVRAINYTDVYAKAYQGLMSSYVGPEYPAWGDYYNLGNQPPYQYDVTQAKQILSQAGVDTSKFPALTFNVQAGCESCTSVATIIQSDLGAIGLDVHIQILSTADYYAYFGNYNTNLQNAQQIGQLAFVNSGFGWSPATLTPADYWVTFVSNSSTWGNWPAYGNPTVQKCVNSFTSTADTSMIKSLCQAAQLQIYNDAPYAWIGTFKAWLPPGGSEVWNHNVVLGFLVDPVFNGQNTGPIFNTVTFA